MQCFLQRNIEKFHVSRETINTQNLNVSRETQPFIFIKKRKKFHVKHYLCWGSVVSRETFYNGLFKIAA